MPDVVIVGAGLAGLAAASVFRRNAEAVVIDKGRGVGGRLATRRIGGAAFDHGAQFLTPHSAAFRRELSRWEAAGAVALWHRGTPGPEGVVASAPPGPDDGPPRYRGVPSMTGIAKQTAAGLDVRLGVRATAISRDGDGWSVHLDDDRALTASSLVVTAPVPQALDLLAGGGVELDDADAATLGAIEYDPCIAVMIPLVEPAGLPVPGALRPGGGPIEWLADNQAKGVSTEPALTAHTTPEFAREAWDRTDGEIVDVVLDAIGRSRSAIAGVAQVHRWRYAKPRSTHAEPCLVARQVGTLVFAGDAFGGPNVEGAWTSGRAAAEAVLARR